MRRGARQPPLKKYKAATVPPEVRDVMGRVGLPLQARAWSTAQVDDLFAHAGSHVNKPPQERCYRAIRASVIPLLTGKVAGPKARFVPTERASCFWVTSAIDKIDIADLQCRCRSLLLSQTGDIVVQHYTVDYHH